MVLEIIRGEKAGKGFIKSGQPSTNLSGEKLLIVLTFVAIPDRVAIPRLWLRRREHGQRPKTIGGLFQIQDRNIGLDPASICRCNCVPVPKLAGDRPHLRCRGWMPQRLMEIHLEQGGHENQYLLKPSIAEESRRSACCDLGWGCKCQRVEVGGYDLPAKAKDREGITARSASDLFRFRRWLCSRNGNNTSESFRPWPAYALS